MRKDRTIRFIGSGSPNEKITHKIKKIEQVEITKADPPPVDEVEIPDRPKKQIVKRDRTIRLVREGQPSEKISHKIDKVTLKEDEPPVEKVPEEKTPPPDKLKPPPSTEDTVKEK